MKGVFTPKAGWIRRTNRGFYREVSSFGPSLSLDFTNNIYTLRPIGGQPMTKPFGDIITFTRASGGGRFNSSGNYEYLGNDVPRLDYDPVTLQPLGILIEEQRTNLLTYSEQINSTTYNTVDFPVTLTANAATSPSGLVNASLLSPTTSSNAHAVYRVNDNWQAYTSGTSYTNSVFAKDSGGRFLQLTFSAAPFGASQYANFDLQTGTIGAAVGGTASIIPAGNGWYRCSFTATATSSASASFLFTLIPSATSGRVPAFVGVPANGIYIWGAQLEAGAFPTSYIPTEASQVTRAADVASVNTLSPWYNSLEGTLFVEYVANSSYPTAGKAIVFAALSDNSYSNRISLASSTGTAQLTFDIASAGTQFRTIAGNLSKGVSKLAGAYKVAASSMTSLNGSLVSGPGAPTLAALSKLNAGASHDGSAVINGHIRSIRYFPRSNTDLVGMTS